MNFIRVEKKRRREAGVGIIIRIHPDIVFNSPDVNDPNIMAVNLRIHGFNIRIINGYSPTDSGGSDNQKDMLYRQLKTACSKNQKHQKLVIVGDFNATTNVANYKSCYDGTKIVEDPNCNGNGSRLKSFCKSKKLCISCTFYDYDMINQYTWYSNDGKTRKKIDYVLLENFIQKYVSDCRVEPEFDSDSDHRLLKTTFRTPCTRRARRTVKRQPRKSQPLTTTTYELNTNKLLKTT